MLYNSSTTSYILQNDHKDESMNLLRVITTECTVVVLYFYTLRFIQEVENKLKIQNNRSRTNKETSCSQMLSQLTTVHTPATNQILKTLSYNALPS